MSCDAVSAALANFELCEQTEQGARVATHCVYPSFEAVRLYVARVGEGYDVHDGGGAFDAAWLHGREENAIINSIRKQCGRFRLELSGKSIIGRAVSIDWLSSAIISVANASSMAAHDAVARIVAVAEEALVERIDKNLTARFGPKGFHRNVKVRGNSGGTRHFDFVVGEYQSRCGLFINGISPHHLSVSSKYVAFADTEAPKELKFAVYDHALSNDDAVLLGQVSSVVPIASMIPGALRSIGDFPQIF